MNESCHTYEWVMAHIWMSHGTHMNESCHTYEWVMSHIWMRHVTHMNEPCHTYEWVMSHIWMSHVTHMNESCHTYKWVMSHTQSSPITDMPKMDWFWLLIFPTNVVRGLLNKEIKFQNKGAVLVQIAPLLFSQPRNQNQSIKRGMLHVWMSHVTHVNESWHTYECVMSHIWMSHVTPMNASCQTHRAPPWQTCRGVNNTRHMYEWVTSHA